MHELLRRGPALLVSLPGMPWQVACGIWPFFGPIASVSAHPIHTCDVLAKAGTPCIAAHSTARALFASYQGPLYTVQRRSDNRSKDIRVRSPGGYADAAAQDAFCRKTACTITIVRDQSANHNDLTVEVGNGITNVGARAAALPVSAGGHRVYGIFLAGHMGYRISQAKGAATNGSPETMYMVTSGTHVNKLCCFDYGNAETNNKDNGAGHMDAINFSIACPNEKQPRVHADLEDGLFSSARDCRIGANDRPRPEPFVTALLKNNGRDFMSIKSADAQAGPLSTTYAGPTPTKGGYAPMHQEGAIVLGTGGDNSNGSVGSFFEGAMTSGLTSQDADAALQRAVVAVAYRGLATRRIPHRPRAEK